MAIEFIAVLFYWIASNKRVTQWIHSLWILLMIYLQSVSLYNAYVSVCVLFCSAEHRISWLMTVSAPLLSRGPAPWHQVFSWILAVLWCLCRSLFGTVLPFCSMLLFTARNDPLTYSNRSTCVIHNTNGASAPLQCPHEPLCHDSRALEVAQLNRMPTLLMLLVTAVFQVSEYPPSKWSISRGPEHMIEVHPAG